VRAVVQRVARARVTVGGEEVLRMGEGLLAFVGVGRRDSDASAGELARRIVHLRIFADAEQRRPSLLGAGGTLGCVQFTLFSDTPGPAPFFGDAMPAGRRLRQFRRWRRSRAGSPVVCGRSARMNVELVNVGPVTLLLDGQR
jgi:D-tyrosyl-tRNA(Tyr) deacylase